MTITSEIIVEAEEDQVRKYSLHMNQYAEFYHLLKAILNRNVYIIKFMMFVFINNIDYYK